MTHTIQFPENDGKVAIFDTEAEALTAQGVCYTNHMANHHDSAAYSAQTTTWATPRQRKADAAQYPSKWTILVCHHSDPAGATLIEYNPDDYE